MSRKSIWKGFVNFALKNRSRLKLFFWNFVRFYARKYDRDYTFLWVIAHGEIYVQENICQSRVAGLFRIASGRILTTPIVLSNIVSIFHISCQFSIFYQYFILSCTFQYCINILSCLVSFQYFIFYIFASSSFFLAL